MINHDFLVPVVDTDSLTISKKDGAPFAKEEIENLTNEINNISDDLIKWEFEFNAKKLIVLKSKNYIIHDPDNLKKPITRKGSSLKSSTLEPKLKEFINKVIDLMLQDKTNFTELYHEYIKEASQIKNIKPWCSKKTITEKTQTSERANETKVMDAIKDTEYVEGDKVFTFFKKDGSLEIVERFNGDYDEEVMYEKLFKATDRFSTVLDRKTLFLNYSLKRNKKTLEELLK